MALIEQLTEDLRLALLLLGGVLLLSIVSWELVQRWRAKRADDAHEMGPLGQTRGTSEPAEDPLLGPSLGAAGREPAVEPAVEPGGREPELSLPELRVRDRLVEPSIVDLDSALSEPGDESIPLISSHHKVAASVPDAGAEERLPEAAIEPKIDLVSEPGNAAHEPPLEIDASTPRTPRLDWPPEDQRQIVALRVIARNGERFTGVSLRQALLGEGFLLGELEIFHRPVADGRVLLSAASLTQPGSFDLATMDSNLYLGLNLFAVLPGPLPGRDTVDKLLLVGHTLAQRLRGELRDSSGEVLSEARLAQMRREAASVNG